MSHGGPMGPDVPATLDALERRGVAFTHAVEDHGYGRARPFETPGDLRIRCCLAGYRT